MNIINAHDLLKPSFGIPANDDGLVQLMKENGRLTLNGKPVDAVKLGTDDLVLHKGDNLHYEVFRHPRRPSVSNAFWINPYDTETMPTMKLRILHGKGEISVIPDEPESYLGSSYLASIEFYRI